MVGAIVGAFLYPHYPGYPHGNVQICFDFLVFSASVSSAFTRGLTLRAFAVFSVFWGWRGRRDRGLSIEANLVSARE